MIDLIVHKQNEEIKERLLHLEIQMDAILGYLEAKIHIDKIENKGPQPEDEHYFVQEELKPTSEVINVEVPSLKGQYKVILKEKEYDPKVSIDIDPEILDKPTHKKKGK